MAVMAKKQQGAIQSKNLFTLFLHTGRPMDYYSILAINSRKNIRTVLLSPFMVHGTGRRNRKVVIALLFYLSKMVCQAESMKFLQMDLPAQRKRLMMRRTAPVG